MLREDRIPATLFESPRRMTRMREATAALRENNISRCPFDPKSLFTTSLGGVFACLAPRLQSNTETTVGTVNDNYGGTKSKNGTASQKDGTPVRPFSSFYLPKVVCRELLCNRIVRLLSKRVQKRKSQLETPLGWRGSGDWQRVFAQRSMRRKGERMWNEVRTGIGQLRRMRNGKRRRRGKHGELISNFMVRAVFLTFFLSSSVLNSTAQTTHTLLGGDTKRILI